MLLEAVYHKYYRVFSYLDAQLISCLVLKLRLVLYLIFYMFIVLKNTLILYVKYVNCNYMSVCKKKDTHNDSLD